MNRKQFNSLLVCFLFCHLSVTSSVCAEDPLPAVRRYDAGPLTVDDFQAAVPKPLPKIGRFPQYGLTDTDIQYRMKYRYRTYRDNVHATLTEIEVYGIFLTKKSWLAPQGLKILDHEQGHFDITQIHALELNLHFQQQLKDGKALVGRGGDVAAAVQDLHDQIRVLLHATTDRLKTAQFEYDRDTQNGLRAGDQAAQRKRQLELLAELVKEMSANDADKRE